MKLWWGLAAAGLLAACGPGGGADRRTEALEAWQPRSGLWMTTYSADAGGARSVICFATAGPGDVFGDSRPAQVGEMSCQPVERRATADGWVAEQSCMLRGSPGFYRYVAHRDAGGAVSARTTVSDPQSHAELAPAMDIRVERVGDCPADWSPGEVMRLSPPEPDGRWRVILPGQNGQPDRIRELAALPGPLAALAAAPPATDAGTNATATNRAP